jgi:hypothetical protein
VSGAGTVDCASKNDCLLATSYCCLYFDGTGTAPNCQANGSACSPGSDVFCDGPEDCGAGQVCCAQQGVYNGQTVYLDFQCQTDGTCNVNEGERIVCGDHPTVCPAGTTCKASTILPIYEVCATN